MPVARELRHPKRSPAIDSPALRDAAGRVSEHVLAVVAAAAHAASEIEADAVLVTTAAHSAATDAATALLAVRAQIEQDVAALLDSLESAARLIAPADHPAVAAGAEPG